ncbi:hypothetical protein HC031_19750 [Planosporangium thailandense]|uniref:Integral membrane protein n=1 Tax=Planosporangium thailandense TaxID=765197 RepID=A0ABX0Y3B6_9ACTN|nr:hypothetical protein [Planosporangium thailandense]NJC71933.1 hypothetical protein [Planosporangium thailandense]
MVINLAGPGENAIANGKSVIADSLSLRVMGTAIVCLALVIVLLGAFIAISGRPVAVGYRRVNHHRGGKVRLLGLAQILLGAGMLMLGLQGFLMLSWLFRTVVLGLTAVIITTGAALQVSLTIALARKP